MKFTLSLLFFICSIIIFAQSKETNPQRSQLQEILILNSYHQGFKWTDDITSAIINELNDSIKYRVFIEYMDSKRFQTPEYFDQLNQLYLLKYKGNNLSGIICSDNNALDFIIKYGESIWGKVPVVFCGLNNPENYINIVDTTQINGIEERIDIYSTLKVAKQIQPDLDEIIVIGDNTLLFPIFYNQFKEAISKLQPLTHQLIITNNIDSLRNRLSEIKPEKKAIYLLSLYVNKDGIPREMALEARGILNNYNMYVYSNWDFLMPNLIVGGKLVTGNEQGLQAAKLMKKRCENVQQKFPFSTNTKQEFVFDYNQLQKFNIPTSKLPNECRIVYRKSTLWDKYATEISISLIIFSLLIIIILILSTTIIQRKKAEYELIESENRLELAIEGANQGLWDVNLTTKNIYINQQFANLLGYQTPKEIQLELANWQKLFYANDLMQIREAYNLHKEGKLNSMNCEVRMIHKSGNHLWMAIHGKISELDHGKTIRITGSILDISNQKEFEYQLRRAKERAEESDRLKSSFLANMSHEIRTPMNTIIGFTDLINAGIITENERNTYLNLIRNSSESLLSLINDIIDISKIESGQMVVIKDNFDLNGLFNTCTGMAETMVLKSGKPIIFQTKRESDAPFIIYSDFHRLEQVILNLITNAIKFTFSGSIKLGYELQSNGSLSIYVNDTGIGIAQEHLQIIFERFRQGDEGQARRFGGTGLGLAISRSITELLGGEILVTSQQEKGTTFTLSFPSKSISSPYL